jgi:hypothetical protein
MPATKAKPRSAKVGAKANGRRRIARTLAKPGRGPLTATRWRTPHSISQAALPSRGGSAQWSIAQGSILGATMKVR